MTKEERKEVLKAAKNYESKDEFIRTYGWEDWMYDLLEDLGMPAPEDDELTDVQGKAINDCLGELWEEAHRSHYSEAQKRATLKWKKENIRRIELNFNKETDSDILEVLDAQENKQGFVKELIRQWMTDSKSISTK